MVSPHAFLSITEEDLSERPHQSLRQIPLARVGSHARALAAEESRAMRICCLCSSLSVMGGGLGHSEAVERFVCVWESVVVWMAVG